MKLSPFTAMIIIAVIGTSCFVRLLLTAWKPYPFGWLFFAAYLGLVFFRLRKLATQR